MARFQRLGFFIVIGQEFFKSAILKPEWFIFSIGGVIFFLAHLVILNSIELSIDLSECFMDLFLSRCFWVSGSVILIIVSLEIYHNPV